MLSCLVRFNSFGTSWTVAYQAPLAVDFPRQEHWSGLPCPPPGGLPDPGIEPEAPMSPALAGGFFTWEAGCYIYKPKLGKIDIYLSLSKLFILIIFSVLHCLGLSFLHVGISSYTSRILEVLNIGSSFQGQVINWHYSRQIETHSPPNHQFSSVVQSCLTLCDPMDCSTPGLPVHHQLPESTQTKSTESVTPSN